MAAARIEASEAEFAVRRMIELSADMRGCALLAADGRVLASSGAPDRWQEGAEALLDAIDAAARGDGGAAPAGVTAAGCHVGTEDGEAFALRHGELALVAVTDRFTLASLVLSDARALLRDLQATGSVAATGARVGEERFVPGVSGQAIGPSAEDEEE